MTRPTPMVAMPDSPARVAVGLTRASLGALPPEVSRPSYDVASLTTGVVHLGVGSFHRAHQAVYLDRVAELGLSTQWGVRGIGLRTSRQRAELAAQDHLYTVLELSGGEPRARVVGALRDYLAADARAAVDALADPRTRLVTLTVTAPTYGADPVAPEGPPTAFELLARSLARRRRTGLSPFTVLSCDNLPGNGDATRRCVLAAAEQLDPGLARWIEANVAFPNSMADRITPPTSAEHHRLLRRELGVVDRALVVTEPSSHWVVEDRFSGPRPPLEEVGVRLVADARPYVEAKMRLLNAGHVALGFLGEHGHHTTTDAAMADRVLGPAVVEMLAEEVCPLLEPVPGLDLAAYLDDVLARLRNPAIADPLARLRRRGSVRVRNYVLPSLERAVTTGRPRRMLTVVVAAWIDHLQRTASAVHAGAATAGGLAQGLADPDLPRLLGPASRAAVDVRPLLAVADGFEVLRDCAPFVEELQAALADREVERRAAAS